MQDSPKDKFPPDFWSWLQQYPDASISAIIRVNAISPEVEDAVKEAGCRVRRRLQLTPALAVEGTGRTLMQLAAKPWVLRVEPDQMMRAL